MNGLSPLPRPLRIAHRGVTSLGIENSLAAFRAAVENPSLGIDGVELDVHSTRDGELVVHHDATLRSGREISTLPVGEVVREVLGDGSAVPTLGEALEVLRGVAVFVEAKGVAPLADARLHDLLRGGPTPDRYQVHSFDHRVIARLAAEDRGFVYGVLSTSWPVDPVSPVWAAGARVLWQQWQMIDFELMERCRDRSIAVIAWTVPPHQVERMTELGVAGVCVDV